MRRGFLLRSDGSLDVEYMCKLHCGFVFGDTWGQFHFGVQPLHRRILQHFWVKLVHSVHGRIVFLFFVIHV